MVLTFGIIRVANFRQILRGRCKIRVGKQGVTMLGNLQQILPAGMFDLARPKRVLFMSNNMFGKQR